MSLFLRNLNKYGRAITLEDRNESIINGLTSEVFTNPRADTAIVSTPAGVTVFDDTNIETAVSHIFKIAYRADATAETWILFNAKRYRIVSVINCCEADEVLHLMATERGPTAQNVNRF